MDARGPLSVCCGRFPLIALGSLSVLAAGAGRAAAAPYPLVDTFSLHSLPSANHTIYLDFDGHVTSGTSWNSGYTGGADIVTPMYDFDGSATAFTDAEKTRIQEIFRRVAEDYSPFNVNVTTQEPAQSDLIKSGVGDTRWGIRVAIGGDSTWMGQSYGGYAKYQSFNWASDTPVMVFPNNLGTGNERYTAECISHEVGHSLNVHHDGTVAHDAIAADSYYQGHGSGTTAWAPIMGNSYYKEVTQWSKGEYTWASTAEDDLSIITTQNGFTYRVDDHGDSIASASAMSIAADAISISGAGIIERNTDEDVLSLHALAGPLSLSIDPAPRGPNLDILTELLDSSGDVLASSNPAALLSATIDFTVAAEGDYFLRISGVGYGDPASTGYSDYGSLGQYFISGTMVPEPGAAGLALAGMIFLSCRRRRRR